MDKFKLIYLHLLEEAKYESDYWRRIDTYRKIEIYIRKDNHLLNRINTRYKNICLTNVIRIIQKFIKEQLRNNDNIFNKNLSNNPEISYTIYATLSDVYVSGRFKANNNCWRCYISTVLPNENTHFAANDFYGEVYI